MKIWQKKRFFPIVGISENNNYLCCVSFKNNQPQVHWLAKSASIPSLFEIIQTAFGLSAFRLVYATPYPFIWRKYLFFPAHYSQKMIYRQIVHYFNQTLPLGLENVYFDYQIKPFSENDAIRVILYAIKKTYVDEIVLNDKQVLDCELFCFIRGLHYLNNDPLDDISAYCYPIQGRYIHFKFDELKVYQNLPENITVYPMENVAFTEDILEPTLYLKALGASLWTGRA
ncbi:hypothetical protein [Muribacter muris]|uniref:hypothetical protein n=1 Tax=Muribacter muris TaxID=67855 RepID=UPI00069F6C57|nr:hypothetical protein [Muribacter muris]